MQSLEFLPEGDAEFFAAIPAAPAVFLLRADDPQAEAYVSKTTNLKRRLTRLHEMCKKVEITGKDFHQNVKSASFR